MDGTQKPQGEIVVSDQKQESPTLLAIIGEAVKDPSVNTDKLSSIIDVMERLEKRDAERAMRGREEARRGHRRAVLAGRQRALPTNADLQSRVADPLAPFCDQRGLGR